MKGHLPKNNAASFFLPAGVTDKDIAEIKKAEVCINCNHFRLGSANYLSGDGDCVHNPDVTYAVVNSIQEKCEYFGRKK
jgi:hypothetical protein